MIETIKYIFLWLFIFIVGSLIVSFLVYPQSFQSFKSNVKRIIPYDNLKNVNTPIPNSQTTTTQEDELITKCMKSYNECKKVSELKNNINIETLKVEKVGDRESASRFWDTWKGDSQFNYDTHLHFYSYIEEDYPMVFIALRKDWYPIPAPKVIMCGSEGNLIGFSTNDMDC